MIGTHASIRHPLRAAAILAGVVALVLLVWFQPQKLFQDSRVNESLPQVESGQNAGHDEGAEVQGGIETLLAGTFGPLAHDGKGRAKLIELANGDRYIRFQDFEVENGPDLRVYLTASPTNFEQRFVDLGELKGNIGNQNYVVPDSVDTGRFNNVLIWCRRFSVGFAVAGLR
jgi:hypothetical protein